MIDQAIITQIREAEAKATAGPWLRDSGKSPSMQVVAAGNEVVIYHHEHNRQKDARVVPNHHLVCLSRNHILALCDAAEAAVRLEQERDEARLALKHDHDILRFERDALAAKVAELEHQLAVLADERNRFIAFTNTLPHEGRGGAVGPNQVAKWHIESLHQQVAELEKDRERLNILERIGCLHIEHEQGATIFVVTLFATSQLEDATEYRGKTLRSAIDSAMSQKEGA